MRTFAVVFVLAFLPLVVQAQIVKCTKPDGSIELSDRPCANGKNSRVYVRPTNEVSGEYHRRLAVEQRIQARQQYEAEVRAASRAASQAQADEDAKADREYQRQLNDANAKAQEDARRAARRQAARANQPSSLVNCDGAGCWDTSGRRYNSAAGDGNFFRQDGRFCQTIGSQVQCN